MAKISLSGDSRLEGGANGISAPVGTRIALRDRSRVLGGAQAIHIRDPAKTQHPGDCGLSAPSGTRIILTGGGGFVGFGDDAIHIRDVQPTESETSADGSDDAEKKPKRRQFFANFLSNVSSSVVASLIIGS